MKYIKNETINHFKKFIGKLYKKDEESILNKKKKREEIKQKNKAEKNKLNKNTNGVNQYGNYMGLYMNQMPPINNPQQGYLDGYPNIYYYNNINSSYQYPTHMIGYPYFPQYIYEQPKTLEEQIDLIYQRGIVNNIIGALFIKEIQDKKKNGEKRKVPVATVELEEEQGNNTLNSKNSLENKIKNEENKERNNENNNSQNMEKEEDNSINNDIQNKMIEQKNELKKPEFID